MRMCVHNQLVIATLSKRTMLWVEKQQALHTWACSFNFVEDGYIGRHTGNGTGKLNINISPGGVWVRGEWNGSSFTEKHTTLKGSQNKQIS